MIYLLLVIAFCLSFLALFLIYFCFFKILASVKGAPYAGTNMNKVREMIKMAKIKSSDKIVDLGSGDGRILIEAAERNVGKKFTGFEIDPFLYLTSKRKIKKFGLENRIKIIKGDYFKENLSEFTVIFLFLIPYQMNRLEEKLKKEIKAGAKIISYGYKFNNWGYRSKKENIYLYIK